MVIGEGGWQLEELLWDPRAPLKAREGFESRMKEVRAEPGRREREEGVADLPGPPCLHGVMQRGQWDLAHDEEDHLRALIRGQRAGKGACGRKTVERFGPVRPTAAEVSQLSLSAASLGGRLRPRGGT